MGLGWTAGIGDPTATGYLTVAAYFGAAILCARAALRAQGAKVDCSKDSSVWLGMLCLFLILGINKQLDLQSLLTTLARTHSRAHDWYDGRQWYRTAFVIIIGSSAVLILSSLLWYLRLRSRAVRLPILGLAFSSGYVVLRAASFHHIARVDFYIPGMRWNWLIEVTGIAIVTTAAALYHPPGGRIGK